MTVCCPSCHCDRPVRIGPIPASYAFAGRELPEKLEPGMLYRCPDCALAFRHPLPSSALLESLYRSGKTEIWQYQPERRTDWRIAREWLARRSNGRRVLDLGCFDGAFAQYLGSEWVTHGIEINDLAAERARKRGVEVVGKNVSELANLNEQFDAVVAFDVIEHVPDPGALLAAMAGATRTGGLLIVASGNADAPSWKLMGSTYWYCTIPEHLAFISESWCRMAAQRFSLDLAYTETYSHEQHRTIRLCMHEIAANLLYQFFPGVFASLRRLGLGDKDTNVNEELAYFPPTWTTARDHIIAIFEKR